MTGTQRQRLSFSYPATRALEIEPSQSFTDRFERRILSFKYLLEDVCDGWPRRTPNRLDLRRTSSYFDSLSSDVHQAIFFNVFLEVVGIFGLLSETHK